MKALKILSLSLASTLGCSPLTNAQGSLEDRFIVVDRAVAIVEKFPNVNLRSKLKDSIKLNEGKKEIGAIIDNKMKSPLPNTPISDHIIKIAEELKTELDLNKFKLDDDKLMREYKILFHHTLLLFSDTSTPGSDFDETLLTTFHIHRNKVKQMAALLELKAEEAENLKAIKESIDSSNKILTDILSALNAQKKDTKDESKRVQAKADLLCRKDVIQKTIWHGDRLAMTIQQLDSTCLAEKETEIEILKLNKELSFWTFKKNKEAKKIIKKECKPAAAIAQQ